MGELQKQLSSLAYRMNFRTRGVLFKEEVDRIVGEMTSEIPEFVGYGASHDELFDAETKMFEWCKRWLMPTAQKEKVAEKEGVNE